MERNYSIQELVASDSWVYGETATRKLIHSGELRAVNLNKDGSKPFWRINQSAVDEFLKSKGL